MSSFADRFLEETLLALRLLEDSEVLLWVVSAMVEVCVGVPR